MIGFNIRQDWHFGSGGYYLQMFQFDGQPKPWMWQTYNPPQMLPTQQLKQKVCAPGPSDPCALVSFSGAFAHLFLISLRSTAPSTRKDHGSRDRRAGLDNFLSCPFPFPSCPSFFPLHIKSALLPPFASAFKDSLPPSPRHARLSLFPLYVLLRYCYYYYTASSPCPLCDCCYPTTLRKSCEGSQGGTASIFYESGPRCKADQCTPLPA